MKEKLTEKEIEEGYFIDDVLGKCNIKKTLDERNKKIEEETEDYEAFDNMHNCDNIVNQSTVPSLL